MIQFCTNHCHTRNRGAIARLIENGCGLQGHRSAGYLLLLPCPFHWPPTEHAQRRGPLTPKGKAVDVLI